MGLQELRPLGTGPRRDRLQNHFLISCLLGLIAFLPLLAAAPGLQAQGLNRSVAPPSAEWWTLTTEHFRVHYPVESEAWARHVAARLESIRAEVETEVGFAPREKVDVIVSDPVASANGFALPILGWPRMVLWTSPPGADSVIGHYRDWPELLALHEDTHLVHLLRPSRNPLRRVLAAVVPLSPLANAPRWVSEGYATVVEGRLTGTGRPNSDLRAAILRRWALAGKLPSYGRLASDGESFLGMSMAYLAGSAYLEWLEERAGEGSLRDLWARVTAREARSFDAAFVGVFGDSPQDLWDRFRAEITWRALELERVMSSAGDLGDREAPREGPWVEGDLWLDLSWATGAPAVSPDGSQFAVVLRDPDAPPELAVFATEVDGDALEERDKERRRIAEADPEDVPAVDPGPPPRRRLHTLPTLDGAAPSQPRWLPTAADEPGALLLVRYLPDQAGFLHPDLFRWTPESGELRRVTHGADLRDPDPAPAAALGSGVGEAAGWTVAVRNRHGLSQLVRVDLGTGAVADLTEAAVDVVYDSPRLSPDGERVVFVRHAAGQWALVVHELASGEEETLPLPPGATLASPAWGAFGDGASEAVLAVVGLGGFIDVFAFVEDEGDAAAGDARWSRHRVTRVPGAALAPEPALPLGEEPAGVFYLSLEPDGLDLRRLALPQSLAGASEGARVSAEEVAATVRPDLQPDLLPDLPADLWAELAPVVRPAPPAAPPVFAAAELPVAEPYGAGPRQEWMPLLGGAFGAAGSGVEIGARAGDLLGRLDTVAFGAFGEDGAARGGAIAATWRGWPVDLSLHLVGLTEEPSRQPEVGRVASLSAVSPLDGSKRALDIERYGVELAASWEHLLGDAPISLSGGVWFGQVERRGRGVVEAEDEVSLFVETGWAPRVSRGEMWGGFGLHGRFDVGDSGDGGAGRGVASGGDWTRARGRLRVAGGWGGASLALGWERGSASGDAVSGDAVSSAPAAPWQLFQVGGLPSSLRSSSLDAPRVAVPALPAATLVGREVEAQRVELKPGFVPLPLFWARYRVASSDGSEGGNLGDADWLSLAGVEWRGRFGPAPLLRLPELGYRLGVAEILDGPVEGDREWWAALTWRP